MSTPSRALPSTAASRASPRPPCTFRPSRVRARHVVGALALRELQTRFGRHRLGYLWAILDPAAQIAMLTVMFATLGRRDIQGHPFIVVAAIGVLGFTLVRSPIERCVSAIEANRALFTFRQVLPSDAVIARALVEAGIVVVTSLLGWLIASLAGMVDTPPSGLLALLAATLAWVLSLGLAMVAAVAGAFAPAAGRVVGMVLRGVYFFSAVFYPAASLPPPARDVIMLNPIAHAIELVRGGLLSGYDASDASVTFLAAWAFFSLVMGAALMAAALPRLRTDD